jgi:hypothetical protein
MSDLVQNQNIIMRKIFILILFSISICSPGQFAYPYKVFSENTEFFVKSIPFSDQVYTELGKTIVCKTSDSLNVLYTIPRYFPPDYLFVSNNGNAVCFVLNWFTPFSDDWDRNVIFFYQNGELIHAYTVDQFIDSTLNKRIYSLLYNNEEVDSLAEVREGVLTSVGVKKGTTLSEEYLNLHNCFIKNDLIYVLTQNQYVNIFDLNDGNLVKRQSFNDFTRDNWIYPNPRKIETTQINIPIQFGLPKLSYGNDYESSFAQKMNLTHIEPINGDLMEKYKVYSFQIYLSIDSSGSANNIYVECDKDTILKNEMAEFLRNSTFDENEVPKGIEKWYFNDISFYRKKSEEIAIREREQKRIQEQLELQKKLVADSINGVYIPKDLNDCFLQLNRIINKVDKEEFKNMAEQEAVGMTHFSIGLWMRNNWQLWSGSRLSKYFNEIGISHPDDMSRIILDSYHRYLRKELINLDEQVQDYKNYWEKAKAEQDELNEEYNEYSIGDTVLFNYLSGFSSNQQKKDFVNCKCVAEGIVTGRNEISLELKVRLIKSCGRKGIVIFDSQQTPYYKYENPKDRRATKRFLKTGKEEWLHYLNWEQSKK